MASQFRSNHPIYNLLPMAVEGFDSLADLALDMRWSWDHSGDKLWHELEPALWDLTHNPWVVLQTVSRDQLIQALADPAFRKNLDDLIQARRNAFESPAWFQINHAQSPLTAVAYFSMEFMLSEALPIYSGGLGNVAGDQLKAASDLGVPVVGVSLLYQQGYFRQVIDRSGAQQAIFPYNDPGQLPITPLRYPNGEWLRFQLDLPGFAVWLRVWQVQVGRVNLFLLDSNDAANYPPYRGITSELYGGSPELRLQQELVLGIGGWQLLTALGIKLEVCHLNEGHAAFAVLERARCMMEETGQDFNTALTVTRAGNLFTTHTAVAAGFDRFEPALITQYLGRYAKQKLRITQQDLFALGCQNPNDPLELFNMAFLAIHASGAVNGVSQLHGKVSRHIFGSLFPRWPEDEVPIGHVTNGVHMPTWDSEAADTLWTDACGKNRWLGMIDSLEHDIRKVSDATLWKFRNDARTALIFFVRDRLSRQLTASDASPETILAAKQIFDPTVLTVGFARRFATYKRPNLLLHDPERLVRILTNPDRPVQLILAGKAHPADQAGQSLIQQWMQFIQRPEVGSHVIFLSDYDMLMTEHLVQGVDVWINTPRRPWEACGTSGMKVLVNGGINLSERDGWWAEAYAPDVGWAIGDGQEHGDDPSWDAAEAEALYDVLENEVIPEFYARDANGIPVSWSALMRESMARLTPYFSTNRSVREYTDQYYLPAATAYRERAADQGSRGTQIVRWRQQLDQKWTTLRFGELKIETADEQYHFEIQVYLKDLDPGSVTVEIYADSNNDGTPTRFAMKQIRPLQDVPPTPNVTGRVVYRGTAPATRPIEDYTVRLVPQHDDAMVPLEAAHILWQR